MIPNNEPQKPMVQNISCIIPETDQLGGLFLGNVFGAQNAQILKQYGIRAIITSSAETKINYSFEDIPFHLKFQAHDKDDYYISEHVNDCIHFIEQHRKFTNVFVHCYAGVSRSSAIICAYLMFKFRWPLQKTMSFLVFKRVVAKPNQGFYNQLKDIETKLKIGSEIKPPSNKNIQQPPNYSKPSSPQIPPSAFQNYQPHQRPQSLNPTANTQKPPSPQINQIPNLPKNQTIVPQAQQPNQKFDGGYNVIVKDDSIKNYERVSNSSRILQGRPSMYQSEKSTQQAYQNHNSVPIPRILNRKSEYNSSKNQVNQEQGLKKTIFNDYMSPQQQQQTSPRYHVPQKTANNRANSSQFNSTSKSISQTANGSSFAQSSVYSTSYQTKKGSEQQQKSKTTSRCLIRPKDLPGYKNY